MSDKRSEIETSRGLSSEEAVEEDFYLTSEPAQRWDAPTKRIVAILAMVLLAFVAYQLRGLLMPLGITLLLAFILDPIADFLEKRLRFPRALAAVTVFFVLVVLLLGTLAAPVTAVPSIQRAVLSMQFDLNRIINDIGAFFERPVEIWEYRLDLSPIYRELSASLRRFVGTVAQGTLDVVFSIASGAFWLIFILIAAFYLVRDADRLIEHLDRLAPPGYERDVVRLRQEITDVWNAFLRGQLVLGLAMAAVTAVIGMAIGLPYAWALGLLAGVLEFVPNIGPIIAAIPAILLALIQGSSFLPLGNFWFAVLVTGVYTLLQQIENNFFVPRILGRSLNLHPLAVLIAILAGGRQAGILGMLLAAPVLATLRVLGRYILCRLYDRDPFAATEVEEMRGAERKVKESRPGLFKRVGSAVLTWLREQMKRLDKQRAKHSDSTSTGER